MEFIQRMELMTLLVIMLGLIIFGVVQCFFGYRIFKFTLKLIGFLLGAVLAGGIGAVISQEAGVGILTALIGGFIGAALMVALHFVGVFLLGASLGGLLGLFLSALSQNSPDAVSLILAIIGGVAALIYHKFMIITSTAFAGAWIVVTGIFNFNRWFYVLTSGRSIYHYDFSFEGLFSSWGTNLFAMVLCWLALGIFGVIVQYRKVPPEQNEVQPPPVPNSKNGVELTEVPKLSNYSSDPTKQEKGDNQSAKNIGT